MTRARVQDSRGDFHGLLRHSGNVTSESRSETKNHPTLCAMSMPFEATPALATRWHAPDPETRASLFALWSELSTIRLESALAPGLAAELHVHASRLPLGIARTHEGVSWRTDVVVPSVADPQLPEPFYRFVQLLHIDLPALIADVTNRRVAIAVPRRFTVAAYRKGSWVEEHENTPPGSIRCSIGISAGQWPVEWGGHDEWFDERGVLVARRPPVMDAIDLADASLYRRVAVLTHHVERLEIQAVLSPDRAVDADARNVGGDAR